MTPAQGVEDVVPGIVSPGEPPLPSIDTSMEGHPWKKKVEQTGSTLGLSEIQTADTPPVHDNIHRQGASFSPLIHSQCQLQV